MMTRKELWNIHNEAMDAFIFARIGYDPQRKEKVFTEEEKLKGCEKALEMEKQAVDLIRERYDQTQSDEDKLTESIYSRSAAWIAMEAKKYEEAEKIALTALARGAHPEEKQNLYEVLFTAVSRQGFPYRLESEQTQEQQEPQLAGV